MQEIADAVSSMLSLLVPRVMKSGAVTVTLEELLTDEAGDCSVGRLSEVLAGISSWGMELYPPASEGSFDTERLLRRALPEELIREQVRAMIVRGEITAVEFKSSLRFDYKRAALGEGLELEPKNGNKIRDQVMKAICAFYNTDGGEVLVGVSDSGCVLGIDSDYPLVRRSNSVSGDLDAWLQRFNQDLSDCFVDPGAIKRCVHAEPVDFDCKTIVRIQVGKGQSLGFIRLSDAKCGHSEAFVREFVTSRALQPHEIESHVLARDAVGGGRRLHAVRGMETSAA
jgi:hypothetical protein